MRRCRMFNPYVRWGLIALGAATVATAAAAAIYVAQVAPAAPSEQSLLEVRVAEPSTLLAADGKPLATYRRLKQKRPGARFCGAWAFVSQIPCTRGQR